MPIIIVILLFFILPPSLIFIVYRTFPKLSIFILLCTFNSTNNNLGAKIYSSGNDLLVTRADDDSGIKYRLISSKNGLKLNKYVNDVGSTLWEAAAKADLNTKVNKADNHNIAIGYDAAKKALSVTLDGVYIGNCTIAK